MDYFENTRVKWPYVTHLVDRRCVHQILPIEDGRDAGALVLARVTKIGRHGDLETADGRRQTLFVGDVFVGALGDRHATRQYGGVAVVSGSAGHVVSIAGVVGQVAGASESHSPTAIEFLGRLADEEGRPLNMKGFQALPQETPESRGATTVLSLGAGTGSGKSTTAAHLIRNLADSGHVVAAAKLTGMACVKDTNLLRDAGAVAVFDITHAGWPSTANLALGELLSITSRIRTALAGYEPEFVILEIADGIIQRETAMLLADPSFRDSIDAVVFSARDALSCEAGVRRLTGLGYTVLATGGHVANNRLDAAEAEASCDVPCVSNPDILAGRMSAALRSLAEHRQSIPAA